MTKHFITFLIVTTLLNFCPSKYVEEPKCSWKLAVRYWNCLNVVHDVNWDICFLCSLVATDLRLESKGFQFESCCSSYVHGWALWIYSFRKPTVIPGARDWLWFSCEIAHCGKSLFSVFEEFVASIRKILILAGRLGTRISFYKV